LAQRAFPVVEADDGFDAQVVDENVVHVRAIAETNAVIIVALRGARQAMRWIERAQAFAGMRAARRLNRSPAFAQQRVIAPARADGPRHTARR
jgi:hypothetical protein